MYIENNNFHLILFFFLKFLVLNISFVLFLPALTTMMYFQVLSIDMFFTHQIHNPET